MLIITGIAMGVGLVGCNSERRAWRTIHRAERINPEVPPKYCADKFKGVDSKDSIYIYKQGEPVVIQDTVMQVELVNDTVVLTKVITRNINTTDTIYRQVKITEVNKAREVELTNKVNGCNTELTKRTSQRNMWRVIAISCMALIAAWIVKKIWF